jgi:very-short-patch-repair endonuclease
VESTTTFRFRTPASHWDGMRLSMLDQLATANHGVVSMATSGLSRSSWYRAIAAGQIEQLFPGVARLHGTARTVEQRMAAAVLATGPTSLASHRSAAHLWGIPRPPGDPIDVIVVGARHRFTGIDDVVIHRPRDLERLTPQRRSGIACTNVLRTLLDLGAVDRPAVPDAVGHVITNRLATLDALSTVVIQHSEHGRTGIVALREAVAEWSIDGRPTDSMLERTMQRLILRHGLPPVEFHPVICGHEVDFRVVDTPVILECDGWTYHGLQRSNFERDRQRDAELLAAGWIVLRFTYRAITTRPKHTADRIVATIARWS